MCLDTRFNLQDSQTGWDTWSLLEAVSRASDPWLGAVRRRPDSESARSGVTVK